MEKNLETYVENLFLKYGKKLRFKEISILNENNGKPFAKIDKHNLKNIHISISHSNENAVALAIIESK